MRRTAYSLERARIFIEPRIFSDNRRYVEDLDVVVMREFDLLSPKEVGRSTLPHLQADSHQG